MSDSECFRFPSGVERPSGGDSHLVAVLRAFGFTNSGVEVSNSEWFDILSEWKSQVGDETHLVAILRVV